jgi:hypothetical protein
MEGDPHSSAHSFSRITPMCRIEDMTTCTYIRSFHHAPMHKSINLHLMILGVRAFLAAQMRCSRILDLHELR